MNKYAFASTSLVRSVSLFFSRIKKKQGIGAEKAMTRLDLAPALLFSLDIMNSRLVTCSSPIQMYCFGRRKKRGKWTWLFSEERRELLFPISAKRYRVRKCKENIFFSLAGPVWCEEVCRAVLSARHRYTEGSVVGNYLKAWLRQIVPGPWTICNYHLWHDISCLKLRGRRIIITENVGTQSL